MKQWQLKGFDNFSKGVFENGGQNLYVSAKGILQRIWQFDVNKDGYVDLLIANSHGFNEHPNLYIISDPTGNAELQEVLTQGAQTAAVADLNGNGYDDLIIATMQDGHHIDQASYVYFGGADGITENRQIDLAAKACSCCGVGDFDGDGKKEICYLIADGPEASSPIGLFNHRLRVYKQSAIGFQMEAYTDYPTEVSFFTVADIDGDGCDDLYCRTVDGRWLILLGGLNGFSMENSTEVGACTDDAKRFNIMPFGGGNVGYSEFSRSKVLRLKDKIYLFYADEKQVCLKHYAGRQLQDELVILAPNVISADSGTILSGDDLVLLQINGVDDQSVLVFDGSIGYETAAIKLPTYTPRDVLLHDFSGNGFDDLVIVQGRSASGIDPEPRRFQTHNCVAALTGDFDKQGKKSLVFVNQQQSTSYGHVPVYVYLGSKDGYHPDHRLEFPGHSAGTMMPIDFNDNGWPDLLVLHNAEDQPFLEPKADLYWGGPQGFLQNNKAEVTAPLAWGGHCADLNKDGYLDIIACCGNDIRIIYGGPDGFRDEEPVKLDPRDNCNDERGASALWPALADLNGNGWLDFVVPLSGLPYSRIYWGGPEGYSNANSTMLPIENALTVRIADLNKDGYPDLIFGSRASYHRNYYQEGAVTIFWGGPDGYSGYNCCVLPSYQSNNITIADLNNDGWLDIFASSYFNRRERDINSFIYWNDHGKFSLTNRKRLFTHSSSAAWAGDFNEDGYVDLCITNHRAYGNHNTDSAVWWNGPDGFKEENRTWLPTIGPHDMVPTDMGNVMTRGAEEYYISPIGKVDRLSMVGWEGEIPEKTWVNCQIRSASTEEELRTKPFIGLDGTANSRFELGVRIPPELLQGTYLQIKLFLGAVNSGSTPRISEIYVK